MLSESSQIFARVSHRQASTFQYVMSQLKVHIGTLEIREEGHVIRDLKYGEILFSLVGLTLLRMSSCFLQRAMTFNMSRRQGSLNSNEVRGGPRRTGRMKAPLHQGSVQRSSCTDRDWTRESPDAASKIRKQKQSGSAAGLQLMIFEHGRPAEGQIEPIANSIVRMTVQCCLTEMDCLFGFSRSVCKLRSYRQGSFENFVLSEKYRLSCKYMFCIVPISSRRFFACNREEVKVNMPSVM